MKYKETNDYSFLWGSDYFLYDQKIIDGELHLYLKSRPHSADCWKCGQETRQLHATYERIVQEVPIGNRTTWLHIRAYKYDCGNPECSVKTFTEPLPFVHSDQKRTDALNEMILATSIFMSNEGTSVVLRFMGVKISNDSIGRLWKHVKFEDRPDVEIIGIDDVATRKGQKYATIVYDKSDGNMIALIRGRDGAPVTDWLKDHPKIRKVARDRARGYASAISAALPEAMQVADRFHLFQNLIKCIGKILRADLPSEFWIKDGQPVDEDDPDVEWIEADGKGIIDTSDLLYDNSPPLNTDGKEICVDSQRHIIDTYSAKALAPVAAKRLARQELVRKVREDYANMAQPTYKEIAQKRKLSPKTVRNYVLMSPEEVELLANPRKVNREGKGAVYKNIVYKMMADGHDASVIYSYLRNQGAEDSPSCLTRVILAVSDNHFNSRIKERHVLALKSGKKVPKGAERISRQKLMCYVLTLDPKKRNDSLIESSLPALRERYPVIAEVEEVFMRFHSAIMGGDPDAVDMFIRDYDSGRFASFCHGLTIDIDAVKNAVTETLSSGFVEGGNCKFKAIKRVGYGRADLESLEAKCRAAFAVTKTEFNLPGILHFDRRKRSTRAS